MPKTLVFWVALLVLGATVSTEPDLAKDLLTKKEGPNPEESQMAEMRKREILIENNPFLQHYSMSQNMRALLNSKARRKRSSNPAKLIRMKKSDLNKLERIIKHIALDMKRELSKRNQKKETFARKRVHRRNYDIDKFVNKKDLMSMIKTIVRENYPLSTEKTMTDEMQELKKGLESISEIKRSLQLLQKENFQDAASVEVPTFIPFMQSEYESTTDGLFDMYQSISTPSESTDARIVREGSEKPLNDHETIEKIFEDVEVIKRQKGGEGGGGGGSKNDFSCSVIGSWTSQMGGKVLTISQATNNVLYVNTSNCIPMKEGFLMNPTWKLCGTNPFPNNGMILVTGINESCRQMAAFIGECKYCDGKEVIQGQWLIGKLAKDCTDCIASQDVIGDVWRKEVLHELRKRRLGLH